ncbi:hypothetical protein ACFOD4_00280 [Pseudoroseomonas globiformis]|uniref:Uncharacterized protein n=1 Tax=Teichococcus globiformis TaxID=2307229 RepID=A0ABV7FTG9_9PROT
MSKAHMPPVPPANRAATPGADRNTPPAKEAQGSGKQVDETPNQGQSGTIKQNTTHQGLQHDR